MRKLYLLIFSLVASLSTAYAGFGDVVDFGAMTLDTDYTLNGDFSDYKGSLTPTESGTLTFKTSNGGVVMSPYSDADLTEAISFDFSYTDNGGGTYQMEVEAGQTYYFFKDFCMDQTTVRFTMGGEEALQVEKAEPAVGTALSAGGAGIVSVFFNKAARLTGGMMEIASHSYPLTVNSLGTSASVDYKAALMQAYADGAKAGDALTIRLSVAETDETIDLSYTAAAEPVKMESEQLLGGRKFRSFWFADDSAATMRLTFSGPIGVSEGSPRVTLEYGNSEGAQGEFYTEDIPFTLEDGRTICLDFSDKLRRPQDMVASGINYGTVHVRLLNVRDAEGNYVYSPTQGALGSYGYLFDYEEVQTNVIAEFTPASGSSLTDVESIEVWMADYANVRFDGFQFTYEEEGQPQTITTTDFTATPDADYEGAYLLNVKVPDALKSKTLEGITLSLQNPRFADGLDHSGDILATYSITPTGITTISNPETAGARTYDLQGRPCSPRQTGIIIRQGKKVLQIR